MKRAAIVLTALMFFACAARAADREIPQQARAAADAAVKQMDQWVTQAQQLEVKLKQVRATVTRAEETQKLLNAAVSGRNVGKLKAAIKKWNPELAGHVDSLQKARAVMKRLGLTQEARDINEALLYIAGKGQRLNGRLLQAWSSTGLGHHINKALSGNGPLGKAIGAARKIKGVWGQMQDAKKAYDTVLNDFERIFQPNSQSAYAGLNAIQNILNEFKDKAPPPVDAILGAYADVVGGFIGALKRTEVLINTNARQMNLMRTIDSADKDGLAKKIKQACPDEDLYAITEIKAPAGLAGRFFVSTHTSRYYLFAGKHLHVFNGSLENIRKLARWTAMVKGKPDPSLIAARVANLDTQLAKIKKRIEPDWHAFRKPLPLLLDYMKYYYDFKKVSEKDHKTIYKIKSWDYDKLLAFYIFDPNTRSDFDHYGGVFTSYVLMDVTVSGSGEGFAVDKARIWATRGPAGTRKYLALVENKFRGLISAWGTAPTYVVGGTHAGAEARQQTVSASGIPSRISVSFNFKMQPKDEDGGGGGDDDTDVDIDGMDKDNETGGGDDDDGDTGDDDDDDDDDDAADDDDDDGKKDDIPGVGGDTGDETTGGTQDDLTKSDVDNMDKDSDKDSKGDSDKNVTNDKYGGLPNTDSDLFGDFIMAIIEGDHDKAAEILTQITGNGKDDPQVKNDVNQLGNEAGTKGDFDKNSDPYSGGDDGPKPGSDDNNIKSAGVDPDQVTDPVDPQADPDAPGDADVRSPPETSTGAGNPFTGQRNAAGQNIAAVVNQQNGAAAAEGRNAQRDVKNTPIPTRGGMQPINAGGATTLTITVWDRAAEDGDIVRISVGGRTVAAACRLTKAPQTFTVTLTQPFTSVSVVALNEGSAPPNTAGFSVKSGGTTLKTTGWSLKKYGMGSTVIRRGGR